jgi:hypothetical protein
LQTLTSISEISKVFQTSGSKPVLVMTEDLENYVCKYANGIPSNKLLIEYLGYAFSKQWELQIPEAAFVNILPEHVPAHILNGVIQGNFFHVPTLGSKFHEGLKEIDSTLIASWKSKKSQIKKISNKADFLKIGLFDIWLSNEDRVQNNPNLMLKALPNGKQIIVIDHEKCFNSGIIDLNRPIYQINEADSILCTDILPLFYPKSTELDAIAVQLLNDFPHFVSACQEELVEILELIPAEWSINNQVIENYLNNTIFGENWIAECRENFLHFINL